MQVSSLLEPNVRSEAQPLQPAVEDQASRQYTTRQAVPEYSMFRNGTSTAMGDVYPSTESTGVPESLSPTKGAQPKHVSFELLLPQSPQRRARLPMRVNIYPHDTTDSIITTVKNFYGLYERRGVIFEDAEGNTLIARYENFSHDMIVYVRVTAEEPELDDFSPVPRQSTSPRRPRLDDAFKMLPPTLGHHQTSRHESRAASRQSHSPQPGRGRRSASANTNTKSRARQTTKSRGTSSHGSFVDTTGDANNYSDSDAGDASVTSSRRGKKEQVASADISVDNIVEGGRRKRAKFDSSELPLFVPPQVPMTASVSSVSPQRRIGSQNCASPYSLTNQQTFAFCHPMQSPQSHGQGDTSYLQGLATPFAASSGLHGIRSRTRGSVHHGQYRQSGSGAAVLPTPDPTLGSASVISDEDVARQLMRLGDASNFSTHGRTSTSTLDDALSGKAEVASSSDESDEGSVDGQELLPLQYPPAASRGSKGEFPLAFSSGETSGQEYEDNQDDSFKAESDDVVMDEGHSYHTQNNGANGRSSLHTKSDKSGKPRALSKAKSKAASSAKEPMSPTSLPTQSRKTSSASLNFHQLLGVDEEDLSSKPRCQRCRKSKKGCDRQRPCQRCKDAGIGIEGCISEDEGNGRKGRYGRHMGVPVKRQHVEPPVAYEPGLLVGTASHGLLTNAVMEKSKKRKR